MLQGVSQQPASSRTEGFAELQENFWPSPSEGLIKRQPLSYVKKLSSCTPPISWHLRNRDTSERYIVGAGTNLLNLFDLDGDPQEVIGADRELMVDNSTFESTAWLKGSLEVQDNFTTAPDGTKTACRLHDKSASILTIRQSIPAAKLVDGNRCVFQVRLKDGGSGGSKHGDRVAISLEHSAGVALTQVLVDLQLGTMISSTAGRKARMEALEDGWYLVSAILDYDAADGDGDLIFQVIPAYDAGASQAFVYIWEASVFDNELDLGYIDLRTTNLLLDPEVFTGAAWDTLAGVTVSVSGHVGPFCYGRYYKLLAPFDDDGGGGGGGPGGGGLDPGGSGHAELSVPLKDPKDPGLPFLDPQDVPYDPGSLPDPGDADYEVQDAIVVGFGTQGRWVNLTTGESGLSNYPTIECIKQFGPGVVIRSNSPNQPPDKDYMEWGKSGGAGPDVNYIGTPFEGMLVEATIIGLHGDRTDWCWGGSLYPGLNRVKYENMRHVGKANVAYVWGQFSDTFTGILSLEDCDVLPADHDGYDGFGTKWGIAPDGMSTVNVRDCHFGSIYDGTPGGHLPPGWGVTSGGGFQEHNIYTGPQRGLTFVSGMTMVHTRRTCCQFVNRVEEQPTVGSASGTIILEDIDAYDVTGTGSSEGGQCFSIPGYLGTIIIRRCTITTGPKLTEYLAGLFPQANPGGCVDNNPDPGHGAFTTPPEPGFPNGFATIRLVIGGYGSSGLVEGITSDLPGLTREGIFVCGTKECEIYHFESVEHSGKNYLNFQGAGFSGVGKLYDLFPEGSLKLFFAAPASGFAGWPPVNKMTYFWTPGGPDDQLTDPEIDAYGVGAPSGAGAFGPAPVIRDDAAVIFQDVGEFINGEQYFSVHVLQPTGSNSQQIRIEFFDRANLEEHWANFRWVGEVILLETKSSSVFFATALPVPNAPGHFLLAIGFDPADSAVTDPGDPRTVAIEVRTISGTADTDAYVFGAQLVEGTNPQGYLDDIDGIRMLTLADYTFLVNNHKTVLLDEQDLAPTQATEEEFFLFVKQGNYRTDYVLDLDFGGVTEKISVVTWDGVETYNACVGAEGDTQVACEAAGGTWVPFTDNLKSIGTDQIAERFKVELNGLVVGAATLTATRSGSVVKVTADVKATSVKVSDSLSDTALIKIRQSVPLYNDLPLVCAHDTIIKVEGEPVEGVGDPIPFYVKFVAEDADFGNGHWEEAIAPGAVQTLDASTMPHQIVRRQDDDLGTVTDVPYSLYFQWGPAEWDARVAGDDTTNPAASFVGSTIRDLFFFKHRLGFLTDDRVVMSEVDGYFNTWRSTVMALLDSDRLDVTASYPEVALFDRAVPLEERVVLFSDRTQFTFDGEPLLTPKTASIRAATNFEFRSSAAPELLGNRIFFTDPLGTFSGVRELFQIGDSEKYDALDATGHVPQYINGTPEVMTGSIAENCLLIKTLSQNATWYVYNYLWNGENQVQSAWSKFTFPTGNDFKWFEILDSVVYSVSYREDGAFLETMKLSHGLTDAGQDHVTRLDHRIRNTGLLKTYQTSSDTTLVSLPFELNDAWVVRATLLDGTEIPVASFSGTSVNLQGNHVGSLFWIGVQYIAQYEPTLPKVKDRKDRVVAARREQSRRFNLHYDDSRNFKVQTSAPFRQSTTKAFTSAASKSGMMSVPVNRKNARLLLVNDSHLPSSFTEAEWDTEWVPKIAPR